MTATYKAIVQQRGKWWIGWAKEIPGVNSQARTRQALLGNLQSALEEALKMNRADALALIKGPFEEVTISASSDKD